MNSDITKKKIYAWVKYECGCAEGIGVSIDEKCRVHNKIVVKVSDTMSLKEPDDMKEIKL